MGLAAGPVLSTTRALLAHARWDVEHGRLAHAETVVRAAITVGRRLQDDVALPHVVLGARVERDAVHMLSRVYHNAGRFAGREHADAYLAQVDSNLTVLRRALRQIRAGGALAADASTLGAWARDDALPLAARRELILAVAFGWAFNDYETGYGPAESRKAALAQLNHTPLPSALERVVQGGSAALGANMLKRMAIALKYKRT